MSCQVEGCTRPHWAKSWCNLHYHRSRRGADLTAPSRQERAQDALDEAEWLMECGASVDEITDRCRPGGMSAAALTRLAYRHGRWDLARAVGRVAWAERSAVAA